MAPYLLLFAFTIACALSVNFVKNIKWPLVASFSILVLFAGLRSEIGWDYEVYQYFYAGMSNLNLRDAFGAGSSAEALGFEPGFSLLIWISASLNFNYQIITAAITVGSAFFAAYILGSRRSISAFLVLYLWYGYYHNFSIIRQGLAAAIGFLAVTYYFRNKRTAFILYIIASSIHFSSTFIIPAILLIISIMGKKELIAATLLCWFMSISDIFRPYLNYIFSNVQIEKWIILTESSTINYKVGTSFILIEYTVLVLAAVLSSGKDNATKFAIGILTYRTFVYALFNDITIAWERVNTFSDPFYALAVGIILTNSSSKIIKGPIYEIFVKIFLIPLTIAYVSIKYDRLLSSESRESSERAHAERFLPYRSMLETQ
jgi:hypothetical protein